MGAKSGIALKSLQWFIRGLELLCAALILGIYAYFLAALRNHDLAIPTHARAILGISGAAVLYTLIGLLLLCCVAGIAFASAIAILLDIAFAAAFIYVAYENRAGAGSCTGYLDTPFGRGQSDDIAQGPSEGFTPLPSFRTACRLQTACVAVAIAACILFVISLLIEFALIRHHRKEKRFGPGPANNYTSGYGSKGAFAGLAARFRRKPKADPADDPNALPEHTHPTQFNGTTDHHAQYQGSAHGPDAAAAAPYPVNDHHHAPATKPEAGYGYPVNDHQHAPATKPDAGYGYQPYPGPASELHSHQPQPAAHLYNDGAYNRA